MQNRWQGLDHDSILNTIEATTGAKLTSLLIRRNSYINRVFELEKKDGKERFIAKFYCPNRWTKAMILEEHRFLEELSAKEIPVIPPIKHGGETLFALNNIPFAVFPKKGGRAFDEFNKESWQELGRLLARLHLIGETFKGSSRIVWKPGIATRKHMDILIGKGHVLPDFQKSLQDIVEFFIKKAEPLFADEQLLLIHGDCHKGNLIHRPGESIYIVDFDDISVGPAVQDLWMLLPGAPEESEQEIAWFLEGYETFHSFPARSMQLIPALKVMRMVHYAAWCALQSRDPDFEDNFPLWGKPRYWNELIKDIQETVFTNFG